MTFLKGPVQVNEMLFLDVPSDCGVWFIGALSLKTSAAGSYFQEQC